MMRRLAAAAVMVALTAGACIGVPRARAAAPDFAALDVITYPSPKPAPPFALPDLTGKTVRLEDFHGRFLLLFFWATW